MRPAGRQAGRPAGPTGTRLLACRPPPMCHRRVLSPPPCRQLCLPIDRGVGGRHCEGGLHQLGSWFEAGDRQAGHRGRCLILGSRHGCPSLSRRCLAVLEQAGQLPGRSCCVVATSPPARACLPRPVHNPHVPLRRLPLQLPLPSAPCSACGAPPTSDPCFTCDLFSTSCCTCLDAASVSRASVSRDPSCLRPLLFRQHLVSKGARLAETVQAEARPGGAHINTGHAPGTGGACRPRSPCSSNVSAVSSISAACLRHCSQAYPPPATGTGVLISPLSSTSPLPASSSACKLG